MKAKLQRLTKENRALKREVARLTARETNLATERDALKAACHKHAAKHSGGREWTELQRKIDSLEHEVEGLQLRLTYRDPQQRRRKRLIARLKVA
jgi:predicted RNase H-like nuclease (RuvC/YqgF family)